APGISRRAPRGLDVSGQAGSAPRAIPPGSGGRSVSGMRGSLARPGKSFTEDAERSNKLARWTGLRVPLRSVDVEDGPDGGGSGDARSGSCWMTALMLSTRHQGV